MTFGRDLRARWVGIKLKLLAGSWEIIFVSVEFISCILLFVFGAVVQLGERLNGIQEVRGSTPLGSINVFFTNAAVAELAYASVSKTDSRKGLRVQFPPAAF